MICTSYESQADFHWEKTKQKHLFLNIPKDPKPKKCYFPAPPLLNIFRENLRDWSLGQNDTKSIDVAQPV